MNEKKMRPTGGQVVAIDFYRKMPTKMTSCNF